MATIKDVAKESGLAVSTVSRILNNRGYISEDARKKVEDAMKKLNYQPNELARSLHRKNSSVIGLIVPKIDHPYFAKVISCIEEAAYRHDYRILICNTQTKQKKEQASIDVCRQNRVAGIIMCTGQLSVKGFEDMGVPVVGWERFVDTSVPVVECDNVQGGTLAAEHLIKKGCKNILYLGKTTNMQMPGDYRFIGVSNVCEKAGVRLIKKVRTMEEQPTLTKTFVAEEIVEILKEYPCIDGIFADNDSLAAQAIRACGMLGVSVPDQIQVVGYDDIYFAEYTSPALTTIHQPVEEMADYALDVMENLIDGKVVANRVIFPVTIVERDSTKKYV